MTEYIDLDTPLELYVDRGGFYRQQTTTLRELLDINKIPYAVADVVERKKGEWYDRGSLSCRCSNCGCKSPEEYSFCPNCGSDNRGRKDG